jgi:hypothetical protein
MIENQLSAKKTKKKTNKYESSLFNPLADLEDYSSMIGNNKDLFKVIKNLKPEQIETIPKEKKNPERKKSRS